MDEELHLTEDYGFKEDRGISGQYNTLEYQPTFEQEERERTAWNREVAATTPTNPSSPPVGGGAVTEVVEEFYKEKENLQNKIKDLTKELSSIEISVPEGYLPDIERAKQELNLDTSEFSFKDYISALDNLHTPAGDYLVEVSERFFESLDGNIKLELFQDYYEMLKEYELLEEYLKRNLGPILLGNEWQPNQPDFLEKVLASEKELVLDVANKERDMSIRNEMYKNAFIHNQELLDFQKEAKTNAKESLEFVKAKQYQMIDTTRTVNDKVKMLSKVTNYLDEISSKETTQEEKDNLMRVLENGTEDIQREASLTQLELMLTLSVETANQEKHHYKHSLRNSYNITQQTKLMDELMIYQNLYSEDVLPLMKVINHYSKDTPYEVEELLNGVTQSMRLTSQEKKNRILDFYKVQQATTQIRLQKINQVVQKESARQAFHTIDQYLTEQGG